MQQMKNRFRGETAKYIRIVLLVIYDILAIFLAEFFLSGHVLISV